MTTPILSEELSHLLSIPLSRISLYLSFKAECLEIKDSILSLSKSVYKLFCYIGRNKRTITPVK